MSSLESVLATPELLEAILLHLDERTLLLSVPLVSHYFNDVVSHSAILQKALFLMPAHAARDAVIHHSILNPLLAKPFSLWFHPFSQSSIKHRGYSIHSFGMMSIWESSASEERFMRRNASWRRMLVQQPAVTRLGFVSKGFSFSPGFLDAVSLRGRVDFPRGLTMGALYDLTQRRLGIAAEYTAYYFRILRPGHLDAGEQVPDAVRQMLEEHQVVYEERGYYPQQVAAGELEDGPRSRMYRHPDYEVIDIDWEDTPSDPQSANRSA